MFLRRLGSSGYLCQAAHQGGMIGFVDLMANKGRQTILFEAKIAIDSLGELFRQVRMYQEGYLGRAEVRQMPFVIVCPDDSNADIIRQEGLHFLKYEPDTPIRFIDRFCNCVIRDAAPELACGVSPWGLSRLFRQLLFVAQKGRRAMFHSHLFFYHYL